MGRLTLAQFEDELTVRLGNSGVTPSRRRRWINLAIEEISTSDYFESMNDRYYFFTVADQRDYDYPEQFLGFETMEDVTNKTSVIYTDAENLQRYDRDATGKPKYWTVKGDVISFWPTPDAVYEIEAIATISILPLDNPGDTSPLHSRWDNAIIFLSAAYGAEALNRADADKKMERYVNYMRSRMTDNDYRKNNNSAPVTIARSLEDLTRPRNEP